MRRAILAVVTAILVAQPGSSLLGASTAPLGFFKNYFVTGDYVVAGVGLFGRGVAGRATGAIAVDGVPADVDLVAAFLYWQVIGPKTAPDAGATNVTFRGHRLQSTEGPYAKALGDIAAPCWSGGDKLTRTYGYRADVLRFLDVDAATGKLAGNGSHAVSLPDGSGVSALGASLVLVYRDPALPLSAIVLYDGLFAPGRPGDGMSQLVEGFYDAATAGKLTHVVSGGQSKAERLTYNGATVAVDPFASAAGPMWDNPTVAVAADPARRQITTGVDHGGSTRADCLTWSAVVYRTTVKDGDGDGLLDLWESSPTPLADPFGRPLPHLAAMGASPIAKDIFIEVGYLTAATPLAYGGVVKPAHSHLPSPEALRLVGDMFAAAPTGPINAHFDVGGAYPAGVADPYVIRGAGLARGGEAIDEAVTVCAPTPGAPPWECQFNAYPGTVGWKTGFRLLRDQVLNGPVVPPGQDDPCDLPGSTCQRRFDQTRHDMFRYALFAHAVGLPKSELACLDASGQPVADVDDQCTVAVNPAFRTPRTNTGIGDFPGGDMLVTLGAFADAAGLPIGSPFMQASTLAHEFGHNVERRHGGGALEPNCKPTYPSVMNYLYQLRGLLDDGGTPHLDFSRDMLSPALDEAALVDGSHSFLPYRLGWYAPLGASYLAGRGTAARIHCDGSPLLTDANGAPLEVPMVRIDARTAAAPIDWNADGDVADTTPFLQDVNFNGRLDGGATPLVGADDWSALRLDQLGARRNVGGLYPIAGTTRFAVGPLSLSVGKGDLGKGDLGKGDLGKGDLGKGDLGKGDLGKGDLGKGDLGKGDLGKGDLGGGDLFLGDPDSPGGELDFETASDLARTPPNEFSACVVGDGECTAPSAQRHDVATRWSIAHVGGVASYTVYRVTGAGLQPGQSWTVAARAAVVAGQQTYAALDTTALIDGQPYTYFAVATYADGVQSDPSNLVTITGRNDAPVLSKLKDVTIDQDSTTGPLAFTVADDNPATVTLAGTSSDTKLVPVANIVFDGTGTARTVTVTPAAGRSGTAVIGVTAIDEGGRAATATFTLTVRAAKKLVFVNVLNAPPAKKVFRAVSPIPMTWLFAQGDAPVDSRALTHVVTLRGPLPKGALRTVSSRDPKAFRYDARHKTWSFALPTTRRNGRDLPAGAYEVEITPSDRRFPSSGVFRIELK